MQLPVQRFDARVLQALGIVSPGPYGPRLSDMVVPVVSIPLGIGAESALGFNDSETDGDNAFTKSDGAAAIAGQNSHIQLLNPSGSGKRLYIDELVAWDTVGAAGFGIGWYDVALTTLIGNLLCTRRGGSSSTAQLRSQGNVGALSSGLDGLNASAANVQVGTTFNPPLRLDPGEGFVIFNGTVNRAFSTTWRVREYVA